MEVKIHQKLLAKQYRPDKMTDFGNKTHQRQVKSVQTKENKDIWWLLAASQVGN